MKSINCTGRNLRLQQIDLENKFLAKKLENPNNTIKNHELQRRWKDKIELSHKMSISNRPNVDDMEKERLNFLKTRNF